VRIPQPFRSALALLLAGALAAAPASACCDDFWSCVGAVATAGLSCAAEAALAVLQAVIDKVVKAESDSSDIFQAELMKSDAEIRAEIAQTQAQLAQVDVEIKNVLADADKIYNEDQAAIRAALLSAKSGQARTALVSAGPTPTPRPGAVARLGAEVSLPPGGGGGAQRFAGLETSARGLHTKIETLRPEIRRLSVRPGALDVAPYRLRLAGEFDGFFRGKTPADAKKKRDELLLEARRRFASNPKTLAAVEKLLNDEARTRGVT